MAFARSIRTLMKNIRESRSVTTLTLALALTLSNFSFAWAGPSSQLDTPSGITASALSTTSFKLTFNSVSNDHGGYLISLYLSNGTPVVSFTYTSTSNGDNNNGNNNSNGNNNFNNNGNNNSNGNTQATAITDVLSGLSASTTYTVTVTALGQGKFTSSIPSSPVLVTTFAPQAVLTIISTSGTYGTPLPLTSTGGVTSDPVTFAISGTGTANACTITNATLTVASIGTCIVSARQVTSTNYLAAASIATIITFAPANQATLTINSTLGSVSTPLTLTTAGGAGTGAVTYALTGSGSATGCTISGNILTVRTFGTCLITATKAGDGIYGATSSAQTSINMAPRNQSPLSVTPNSGLINTPIALSVTGGSGSGAVSFTATSASTALGCKVSGDVISAIYAGLCMVTATKVSDGIYGPITSLEAAITLTAPTPTPTPTPTLVPEAPEIPVASASAPVTTVVTGGAETTVNVAIETSNSQPLEVSVKIPDGSIAGGSTISIAPMSAFVDAVAESALVNVKVIDAQGASVTYFEQPLVLNIGKKTVASAPVFSEDGITWSLIPLLPGTTLPDDMGEGYYVDDSGSVVILTHHLTIFGQKRFQSPVYATSSAPSLVVGTHLRVSGSGGSGSRPIVYGSTTPSICTVSQWGVLVGLVGGECRVTARKRGNDAFLPKISDPISILVQKRVQQDLHLSAFVSALNKGSMTQLFTYGGSGLGQVSYQSLSLQVCSVASSGQVRAYASGQCTILAKKGGTNIYSDVISSPLRLPIR